MMTAQDAIDIAAAEAKQREIDEKKRQDEEGRLMQARLVAPVEDSKMEAGDGGGDDGVVELESDDSPNTAVARPSRQRTPAEVAAEAKQAARPRARHHVIGHMMSACNQFEETPIKKPAVECLSCACTIPAEEPVVETASCRCIVCAAVYCYSCAVGRLAAADKPTIDKPFLHRLPPPEPKTRRVVLFIFSSLFFSFSSPQPTHLVSAPYVTLH